MMQRDGLPKEGTSEQENKSQNLVGVKTEILEQSQSQPSSPLIDQIGYSDEVTQTIKTFRQTLQLNKSSISTTSQDSSKFFSSHDVDLNKQTTSRPTLPLSQDSSAKDNKLEENSRILDVTLSRIDNNDQTYLGTDESDTRLRINPFHDSAPQMLERGDKSARKGVGIRRPSRDISRERFLAVDNTFPSLCDATCKDSDTAFPKVSKVTDNKLPMVDMIKMSTERDFFNIASLLQNSFGINDLSKTRAPLDEKSLLITKNPSPVNYDDDDDDNDSRSSMSPRLVIDCSPVNTPTRKSIDESKCSVFKVETIEFTPTPPKSSKSPKTTVLFPNNTTKSTPRNASKDRSKSGVLIGNNTTKMSVSPCNSHDGSKVNVLSPNNNETDTTPYNCKDTSKSSLLKIINAAQRTTTPYNSDYESKSCYPNSSEKSTPFYNSKYVPISSLLKVDNATKSTTPPNNSDDESMSGVVIVDYTTMRPNTHHNPHDGSKSSETTENTTGKTSKQTTDSLKLVTESTPKRKSVSVESTPNAETSSKKAKRKYQKASRQKSDELAEQQATDHRNKNLDCLIRAYPDVCNDGMAKLLDACNGSLSRTIDSFHFLIRQTYGTPHELIVKALQSWPSNEHSLPADPVVPSRGHRHQTSPNYSNVQWNSHGPRLTNDLRIPFCAPGHSVWPENERTDPQWLTHRPAHSILPDQRWQGYPYQQVPQHNGQSQGAYHGVLPFTPGPNFTNPQNQQVSDNSRASHSYGTLPTTSSFNPTTRSNWPVVQTYGQCWPGTQQTGLWQYAHHAALPLAPGPNPTALQMRPMAQTSGQSLGTDASMLFSTPTANTPARQFLTGVQSSGQSYFNDHATVSLVPRRNSTLPNNPVHQMHSVLPAHSSKTGQIEQLNRCSQPQQTRIVPPRPFAHDQPCTGNAVAKTVDYTKPLQKSSCPTPSFVPDPFSSDKTVRCNKRPQTFSTLTSTAPGPVGLGNGVPKMVRYNEPTRKLHSLPSEQPPVWTGKGFQETVQSPKPSQEIHSSLWTTSTLSQNVVSNIPSQGMNISQLPNWTDGSLLSAQPPTTPQPLPPNFNLSDMFLSTRPSAHHQQDSVYPGAEETSRQSWLDSDEEPLQLACGVDDAFLSRLETIDEASAAPPLSSHETVDTQQELQDTINWLGCDNFD